MAKINDKIPAILREAEILIPCKVDVMLNGARYVDSFLWNIFGSVMSPDEFAAGIVRDMSLPVGFRSRIALQLCEQVEAYADLVCSVCAFMPDDANIEEHLPALSNMAIGLRHLTLEYNDSFSYDIINSAVTPEDFAVRTCADLGLPAEFEAAIALKMRDTIINSLTQWIETQAASEGEGEGEGAAVSSSKRARTATTAGSAPTSASSSAGLGLGLGGASGAQASTVAVRIVSPTLSSDMTQNMWKTHKPENVDVTATAAQPTVPANMISNSYVWEQQQQKQQQQQQSAP